METGSESAVRDSWGDVVKGVLIVLVVFWHVLMKSYLQVDWHLGMPIPGAWGLLGDLVWPFLMPLFLFVSGHYAARAARRPWQDVVRTRIGRLLALYVLWSLVHVAAMWAFPDFPTLVPRTVPGFVESLLISPPDTWYLYALALYFLVAKAFARVPPVVVIGAAAVLSVAVTAGWVEVVSNRGSLLYNCVFFLLGLHLAPWTERFVARVSACTALLAVLAFATAFGAMRLTATQAVPGVWPLVSVVGVAAGLAVAPTLVRVWRVGAGVAWLGRRTLPVYLVHMPLLALADSVLGDWLSGSRVAVQLVAAVVMPVVLTAVLVAASLGLARLMDRDGLTWMFDLVRRPLRCRAPWRLAVAVVLLVACGVGATRAAAITGCGAGTTSRPAERSGQVSIGATGDLLIHDVGHRVPDDGGAGYFDAVRPWFTQDLVTGNLEQVIAEDDGHDKCDGRADCLAFRSDPGTAAYFAGFDLLSMANNHTSDFGRAGYDATRANLAANGIRAVGGRDEVVCTEIGGTTVAVVGFAPYAGTNRVTDLRHVRRVVEAAAASADVVVVHAHMGAEGPDANVVVPGGEEMYGEDRGDPVAFSHAAVDAGADLVIGHGPHSLRGMEFRAGRLIAYSLGNFGGGGVFGAEQATRYGAYLDVRLDADGRFVRGVVRSVRFDQEDGVPHPDPAADAAGLVDRFSQRDFPGSAPRFLRDGRIVPG